VVQCPVCGREVDRLVEGLCAECYREEHDLLNVRDFKVLRCFSCGSIFVRGKWVRPRRGEGLRDILVRLLLENLRAEHGAKVSDVNVIVSDDHLVYEVRAVGSIREGFEEVEENYILLVPLINDLCPSCRSLYRRKEMGVVQIRGFPLAPNQSLLAKARSAVEYARFKAADKNIGDISDVEEFEWGIDVRTTTGKLARRIAYEIHKLLPSRVVETQRVVGVDGSGRRVTRYTASVLLITARRGDLLLVGGRPHLVAKVSHEGVALVDVESGEEHVYDLIRFTKMNVVYSGRAERGKIVKVSDGEAVVDLGGELLNAKLVGSPREGEVFVVRVGDVAYAVIA